MKTKFLAYTHQIDPAQGSGHMMMLRSACGDRGRGAHVAWVRLPQGKPGFRSRPGFGRLYFDWLGDRDIWGSTRNEEATALIRQADTQVIGAPELDPAEVAIFGVAWLVPDEGYRCPVVKVGRGNDRNDILDWIEEQGFGGFVEVYDDNMGLWIVQVSSDADMIRCHAEMIAEFEADGGELTDEDRTPPDGSAFMMMAKLRWG